MIYLKSGREREFNDVKFSVEDLLKALNGEVVEELD